MTWWYYGQNKQTQNTASDDVGRLGHGEAYLVKLG